MSAFMIGRTGKPSDRQS